ncbi:MAG: hydrogenase maturation nickel metallochaperone HypA [Verrucomicrobiota bacterium]|nr:hydrogenase maturation nickel metallochaperone HypA [Limisphaera sp.]MDW8381322.1 hydrogenase maturation nickel metallochaperone HypA [Verrucomicrobiota bacterium]
MHELGLMSEAVRMALEAASAQGAQRVTGIRLRVGTLSGVVPEALQFAFDLVTARTTAEGARLEMERIPAVWRCFACRGEFQTDDPWPRCPACGQTRAELLQGRELEIASIEVM